MGITKLAKGQAIFCQGFVKEALDAVLTRGETADHFLAGRFRKEKRIGSHDRRFISNTVFAFFRWYGWLRKAGIPDPLSRSLAAASAAEGITSETALCWALDAGIPADRYLRASGAPTPGERFAGLLELPETPDPWDLYPEWFREELPEQLRNEDTLPLYMQRRPPLWLRTQTDHLPLLIAGLNRSGFAAERIASFPNALKIADARGSLYHTPEFLGGEFEIQDYSSQCIGWSCQAKPGERWWDVCAGGGGKSLQLADQMKRKGNVFATDIREYKLEDLKRRACRGHFPNIRCSGWDGIHIPERKRGSFDGVLVDAPCSSSGRWRRNPDGRWTTPRTRVEELIRIQAGLLETAAGGVRKGGVLVYATCSLFEREDERIVEEFLSRHPEFRLEGFPAPDGTPTNGMLRTLPMHADCDGSFAARMRLI